MLTQQGNKLTPSTTLLAVIWCIGEKKVSATLCDIPIKILDLHVTETLFTKLFTCTFQKLEDKTL